MFEYFLVNQQEQFTKQVPLKTKTSFNYTWISVAAMVVLALGFYFGLSSRNDLGTYEDPELAFIEFSKSMEMISTKFNKGASTFNYLNEVNKCTSTLGYLNAIENTTSIIFKLRVLLALLILNINKF